jgi:hypothetical protein
VVVEWLNSRGRPYQLLSLHQKVGSGALPPFWPEADAFGDSEQWHKQRVTKLLDFGSSRNERLSGPASRDLLEIGIFHFQCHRAPGISAPSQVRETFSMIGWSASHAASNEPAPCSPNGFASRAFRTHAF